jgi:hypothetical protein
MTASILGVGRFKNSFHCSRAGFLNIFIMFDLCWLPVAISPIDSDL